MTTRNLNSFKVFSGRRTFDYRLGENLDLSKIKSFFSQNYNVKKLWQGSRHILGVLEKDDTNFFLKLSTSEGISIVTQNEYKWNDYFNMNSPKNLAFKVPVNHDSGLYKDRYFFLITDYFDGSLLCKLNGKSDNLVKYIDQVINLSRVIQQLPGINFASGEKEDYRKRFFNKANLWFKDIPINVRMKFKLDLLLKIIEKGVSRLSDKPRHGDFTPWHIIKLKDSKLGLIDGEHALPDGVENYDICYFIQRVYCVLKNPDVAKRIHVQLVSNSHDGGKLKTVLAARAIGGFLDESLTVRPDYIFAGNFKKWVSEI